MVQVVLSQENYITFACKPPTRGHSSNRPRSLTCTPWPFFLTVCVYIILCSQAVQKPREEFCQPLFARNNNIALDSFEELKNNQLSVTNLFCYVEREVTQPTRPPPRMAPAYSVNVYDVVEMNEYQPFVTPVIKLCTCTYI